MSSIIGSVFAGGTESNADQTLAWNISAGLASATQSYTAAALASTTPEVRRLFSEYASQSLMAHEALMGLMVKNSWTSPYDSPAAQLQEAVQQSQAAVKPNQQ